MLNNLHELRAFIQKNCPMFLTNDLTLYAIVGKIVWYVNELIRRSNELNELLAKLETLTKEELNRLNKEVDDFTKEIDRLFSEFKTEINTDLANFKKNITDNYNTFTQEQLNRLDEILSQLQDELDRFKTSITTAYNDYIRGIKEELDTFKETTENKYTTDKLSLENSFNSKYDELNQNLTNQLETFMTSQTQNYENYKGIVEGNIYNKNQEVDSAIQTVTWEINDKVQETFNTYLESDDFKNLLKKYYPSYITLTYYGDNETMPDLATASGYVYDTTNDILYLCEGNGGYKTISLVTMENVIFSYYGSLYFNDNGALKDVRTTGYAYDEETGGWKYETEQLTW